MPGFAVGWLMGSFHVAYPALVGAHFHDDPELTTARILVQLCDERSLASTSCAGNSPPTS